MKFEELHLSPFGYFEDLKFTFSGEDGSLHVIYGANEAGKSTTLRAISGLLYGIPQRSKDGFRFENRNLRIKARIAQQTGPSLTLVRRKGSANTLFDWEGHPVDEKCVSDCVSGLSDGLFSSMFGINHEGLAKGSSDLLQAKGDMAEILFQAGTGIAGVRSILKLFEEESVALFSPNARNQSAKLNAAKAKFKEASDSVKGLEVLSKVWLKLRTDLAKAEKASLDEHEKLALLTRSRNRLERQKDGLPLFVKRSQLIAEIDELGEVVDLPDSATSEREIAEQALAAAEKQRIALTSEIKILEEKIAATQVSAELLGQAEIIKALTIELGAILVADSDLPGLENSGAEYAREKRRLLSELGFKDAAHLVRPNATQRAAIRSLVQQYSDLYSNKTRLEGEMAKTAAKLSSTEKDLLDLPTLPDSSELKACLAVARRHVGLDEAIAKLSLELASKQRELAASLERLTLWTGTAAELERLAIPASEVVERYGRSFADIDTKIAGQCQYIEQVGVRLRDAESALVDPKSPVDLPSENSLLSSRSRRDEGWSIVRQAWQDGLPLKVRNEQFDPDRPLADAFQQSMLEGDRISDRLRNDADLVAAAASRNQAMQDASDELAGAANLLEQLQSQREAILNDWLNIWKPLNIQPLPVSEMRQWILERASIAARHVSIEELTASRKSQESQRLKLIEESRSAIVVSGRNIMGALETLTILIELAEQRLTEVNEQSDQRSGLSRAIEACKAKYEDDRLVQAGIVSQLEVWQSAWQTEMTAIGLNPETTPSAAGTLLDTLFEYIQTDDKHASIRQRISGIGSRAQKFAEAASSLVCLVAPELSRVDVRSAVAEIAARLDTMGKANELRSALLHSLEQAQKALTQTVIDLERAEQKLGDLSLIAGVASLADLPQAEHLSKTARSKSQELEAANQSLLQNASTNPFEEWLNDLASIDPDSVEADIANCQLQVESQTSIVKQKDEEIGSIKNEIRQIDGSDRAAEKSEIAQQALAEMNAAFDRFAHIQVATSVLRGFMNKYKDENQGPVLAKAKEIFRDLTLNEWSTLQTSYDESDNPILEGVRSDNKAVGVEGMSDGTRDALYLALRLASLHHYFSNHEPIPFIVDDIFINLDDRRAVAAFKALLDLADKTQVIFFTHHRHLCELAKSALPKERLLLHTLET